MMLGYKTDIRGVDWPLVEPLEDAVDAVLMNVSPPWDVSIRGAESILDVCVVSHSTFLTTRIAADSHAPSLVAQWLRGILAKQAIRS